MYVRMSICMYEYVYNMHVRTCYDADRTQVLLLLYTINTAVPFPMYNMSFVNSFFSAEISHNLYRTQKTLTQHAGSAKEAAALINSDTTPGMRRGPEKLHLM